MNTKLYLLGSPRLEQNGKTLSLTHRKALALLIYLAMTEGRQSRDRLAKLLWPEFEQKAARTYLRQNLARLRDLLGKDAFLADRETIGLNPDHDYWCDVADFQQQVSQAHQCSHPPTEICSTCLPHLTTAVDACGEDFLAGFTLPDATGFDDWQFFQREELCQSLADLLQQLIQGLSAQDDFEQAILYARRYVDLDLLDEPAHRQLMMLYAQAGQQSTAVRQYHTLVSILEEELGVPPEAGTTELYEAIRTRQSGNSRHLHSGVTNVAGEQDVTPLPPHPLTSSLPHPISASIPFQVTACLPHFVGRQDEITETRRLLVEPGVTVVALVGMGGLGKTTLAVQVAHLVRSDFADGVLWANPAISSLMDILDNWGRAFGYDFSGLADVESRSAAVRGVLAEKSTLLILDNVTQTGEVESLIASGDGSRVLLTTRDLDVAHALNAQVVQLGELSMQSGRELLANILGEERVTGEEEAAHEICQQLHFLPLAVEIAAQRLKSRARMKLAQMVARLSNEQQRLGLEISDRAVRTSFEVSWETLDEELQAVFPLLAVFEGRPFKPEALAYVADLDQFDVEDALFGLSALSLVKEDDEAYYRQHPLLADFAKEKLSAPPYRQHETLADLAEEKLLDPATAYGRLVEYYLAFATENQQNYDQLEPEWGNIGAVIRVAHGYEKWNEVIEFTDTLAETWLTRARYSDARQAYKLAQDAAVEMTDPTMQATNLLRWGEVCTEQGDYSEAESILTQGLALSYGIESGTEIAWGRYLLARIAIEHGKYDEAEQALAECETIYQDLNDEEGLALTAYRRSRLYYDYGPDYEVAERWANQALQIQEAHNNSIALIQTIRHIAQIKRERQEYQEALAYGERAVQLSQEGGYPIELGSAQYILVQVYRSLNRLPEGQALAEQALQTFQRHGDQRLEAMLLYQMSQMHREMNDPASAEAVAHQSLRIFRRLNFHLGCCYVLRHLGEMYAKQCQPEKAQQAWMEAKEFAHQINHQILAESLETLLGTN
ncbi:MAG: NB-ARC domain-containing protein [Chloroflexota bacterium]